MCLLLLSCNSQSRKAASSSDQPDNLAAGAIIKHSDTAMDPANLLPDSIGNVPVPLDDPANIKPANPLEGIEATPNLNPPHGQAGHRCDVPVGASLSGMTENKGMSLCK